MNRDQLRAALLDVARVTEKIIGDQRARHEERTSALMKSTARTLGEVQHREDYLDIESVVDAHGVPVLVPTLTILATTYGALAALDDGDPT